MQYKNNILLISREELITVFFISRGTVSLGTTRSNKTGSIEWKPIKTDKGVHFIYDNLTDYIKGKLPNKLSLVEMAIEEEEPSISKVQVLMHLKQEISRYKNDTDYPYFYKEIKLGMQKSNDLSQACSILRFLSAYKTKKDVKNITQLLGVETKRDLRKIVLDYIQEEDKSRTRSLYGFDVSKYATLSNKELVFCKAYEKSFQEFNDHVIANQNAIDTLVHKNLRNDHRKVIGKVNKNAKRNIITKAGDDLTEFHARTLLFLAQNHGSANIFSEENIYFRYLQECGKEGEKAVSISAVKRFLSKNNHITIREREGFAAYDKLLPHTQRKKPKVSLAKGGFDGWLFKLPFTDKNGLQAQYTVVCFFDYKSEAITGFSVGLVENGHMIRKAYKMHLQLTDGKGYMEIESDRFSGAKSNDSTEFFKRCGIELTQTAPDDLMGMTNANSKSRYFERCIKEVKSILQNYEQFKGLSVKRANTAPSHPNPDYKQLLLDNEAEAIAKIIEVINIHNHNDYKKEKTRWQVFLENINQDAPIIPTEIQVFLSCPIPKVVQIRNSMVKIEQNGVEHSYLFDGWEEYANRLVKERGHYKVKVYFDEDELSKDDHEVHLFGYTSKDDQTEDFYIKTVTVNAKVYGDKYSQTNQDLAKISKTRSVRLGMQEEHNRKSLESGIYALQCKIYGDDSAHVQEGQPLKDLRKQLQSLQARDEANIVQTATELYKDALSTEEAVKMRSLAENDLIRDQGMAVPITHTEEQEIRELKKQIQQKIHKKRSKN